MRLAVLTSGGEAPGMNAIIHGFREACLAGGAEPIGVRGGFEGLVAASVVGLSTDGFGPEIAGLGGTVLGTSRSPDLRLDDANAAVAGGLHQLRLDGLAVAGGSGSRSGVSRLREDTGCHLVYIPATIDADVPDSDTSIGFDSAVDHGVRAIDDLRVSAASLPGRAFLVEVLGADCGRIAEAMAAATPVDAVIVPERPFDLDRVAAAMRAAMERRYAIAVMTEGCGEAGEVARRLGERIGARVRPTVLGHGQRGTSPTARDRALGLAAGRLAAEALAAGKSGEIRVSRGELRFVSLAM